MFVMLNTQYGIQWYIYTYLEIFIYIYVHISHYIIDPFLWIVSSYDEIDSSFRSLFEEKRRLELRIKSSEEPAPIERGKNTRVLHGFEMECRWGRVIFSF